ncbi:MAG: GGDEF domain-containing protein [Polyangiaceae bacterium]|jgi:diguanylate cyclase (GGDEF)-like protein|nr:GGDEF domain-containing protein [Polyangiaceae bacterium]
MDKDRGERDNQKATCPDSADAFPLDDFPTIKMRITEVCVTLPAPRERDRATLTVVSGAETGRVYTLGQVTLIGRGPRCDVKMDDGGVSREHARISREESATTWYLEDLQSSNGTFVDGCRVRRHLLREGDRIQLGGAVHLRFSLTDATEEKLQRTLYESSVRDALTGAYNRKHFNERLASEFSYAVRHGTPLALVLFDVDFFKRVNDKHGHLAGDQVLRKLADAVMCAIRAEDVFARYGGEEFAVIARGSDARGAVALAERIRGVAETLAVDFEGLTLRVTISVGVATLSCAGGSKNVNALIARADEHLYEAKLHGRNRVVGPRA